jgi:2-haloacid dehalogenase
MLVGWHRPGEISGSRQRTIHQFFHRGVGRHPQGRNAVEQPRLARLDATVGGEAPLRNVTYRFWYLTFHSRSSRGDPPLKDRLTGSSARRGCGMSLTMAWLVRADYDVVGTSLMMKWCYTRDSAFLIVAATHGLCARRPVLKRGVAAGRSAQRGTSGAATGGGGPQAPPTRNYSRAGTIYDWRATKLMMRTNSLRALVFDVFGTCVDWRGSVIRDLMAVGRAKTVTADWAAMADEWRREGYIRGIARIRAGETPYVSSDVLFRRKLDELLPKYGVAGLSEPEIADLSNAWRRLDPWPDTVDGLQRLKAGLVISPLSNGSFATLTSMAKRAALPWDCIITTELRQTFKPEREAYLLAPTLLDLQPDQVMLVAAHDSDLRGAQAAGLHTALVPRPLEWGPRAEPLPPPDPSFDHVATDFVDLARQLGL